MALVVNDRVKETSTTTGTGTFSLAGASLGFETFVAGIGNTNTTYYTIVNEDGAFEVGIGTVTDATPDTLSRDTILSSSNSDNAVNFAAGTKDVFCTLPASKAVILDSSGNIVANNGSNLTALNATQLTSGTVPDARFPATLPAANGSALTALNATQLTSGTVPDARFPATLPAVNGSALTNLNASNLASGTVANARLDAQLQDVAGLATTSGKIIQGDGSNFVLSAYTLPTADGTAGKVLTTNGSGAVTFETPTTGDITGVTAGSGLTGGGTSGDVTLNVGAGNLIDVQADQIDVDLSELTTSTSDADGDFFAVVDAANAQKKLTKGNINISGFNNDSGFTTNTGTVTSVSGGNGLTGTVTTSGSLAVGAGTLIDVTADAVSVDLSELATSTSDADGDFFAVIDSANAQKKLTKANINISGFNNDAGYTTNTGDITGVTAGNGLTGGGASGSVTLNVGAGTGIDVAADTVSVDVSDFMSNGSNNRIVTATGTDAMNAEANLTFDGTNLDLPDSKKIRFGTGNDLEIFHNATDSIIENKTGDLILRTPDAESIFLRDAGGNNLAQFNDNGAVNLYHNASKKFETTSTGIDVTGTLLADKGYIAETTLTDGATINWNMNTQSVCKVTLGGNRTLAAPTNGSSGQFASILVIQDGTGSRTLTWNAVYEFASDTAPTLSTDGGKADLFVFRYNGTKWLEVGRNLLLTVS